MAPTGLRIGAHGFAPMAPDYLQRKVTAMPRPFWLVRPRADGGCDYVSFLPGPGIPSAATPCDAIADAPGDAKIEMREGCHLPPQMPLLKRRLWLPLAEAEAQRLRLQEEGGYRRSEPLF